MTTDFVLSPDVAQLRFILVYLTVVVPEIWNNLEMVEKNARTFLKFQSLF